MQRRHLLLAGLLTLACSCATTSGPGPGFRRFEVVNRFEFDVPNDGHELRAWIALPDDREALQRIGNLEIDVSPRTGVSTREIRDAAGNRFVYVEAKDAGGKSLAVETSFDVVREEAVTNVDPERTRAPTAAELRSLSAYLAPNRNVVIDDRIRSIAANVVGNERNPIEQARLIYDWVLDHVSYWVKYPDRMKSSGIGSSEYCLTEGCGNCTDFHSLYTAIARAANLPTRMVYGSFLKGPLNGQDRDQSYHCWIEFHAPQLGWIPLDVAVADLFVDDFSVDEANAELVALTLADGYDGPSGEKVDYYFGNLDARRVTWNRGRDLVLDPAPKSGPVDALPKAYVELDGRPLAEKAGWTRLLTYREL